MTTQLAILPKPAPRVPISIRAALPGDLPFIDALQKMHTHMVGFFPGKQMEKYIEGGHVIIAEEGTRHQASGTSAPPTNAQCPMPSASPLGYCIAKDQYMKRDDVGIIYQLNVMPLRHRHLVGASLVKAAFDRAAYGCRLFSCWCAQDIQANWFWESLGFIPLAFRSGSRAKQRIHIFWQRRIRGNDDGPVSGGGGTPYWFPAQTGGGALGEDRIVLPIPPGTHWGDAKPMVLPGVPGLPPPAPELPLTLPGGQPVRVRPPRPQLTKRQQAAMTRSQSKHLGGAPLGTKAIIRGGRIRYVPIPGFDPKRDGPDELMPPEKPKKERKPRAKNDPKYIAAARELRDRYLEQVNADRMLPAAHGKYDVSRQLEAAPTALKQTPLLDAA